MKWIIILSIVLIVGCGIILSHLDKSSRHIHSPHPTIMYSNPIGPTQSYPFQLESKLLEDGVGLGGAGGR